MTSLSFCDFFAGIGGIRLGLERAGHRCVWSCELAPFPRRVYAARFGAPPEAEDICDVRPEAIPDADLWTGGFPCQDLSSAGRRAGLNGERSGLVWRLLDLAAVKRPRWILLENVPGLLNGRDAEDEGADVPALGGAGMGAASGPVSWFGALLGALDGLGYDVAWRVLDARHFGVPQRRRRVFILAGRAGDGVDPGAVLLEPEGRRRDPAARGEARARVARGAEGGAGVAGALTASYHGQPRGGDGGDNLIANAITASAGHHGHSSPRGDPGDNLIAAPVTAKWARGAGGPAGDETQNLAPLAFDGAQITHPENRARCRPGDPAPSLAATGQPFVAYSVNSEASCAKRDHARETDLARALDTTGGFASGQGGTLVGAAQAMAVRRLTPTECERLQGFPDGWTALDRASDSERYRVLGNSVAVPVLAWIGARLRDHGGAA